MQKVAIFVHAVENYMCCELLRTNRFDHKHENSAYRQVSNIRRTFVCNKIVDHSDVVGASLVGAAPTTSLFST